MNKRLFFSILFIASISNSTIFKKVDSEVNQFELNLECSPIPKYEQLVVGKNYTFNFTIKNNEMLENQSFPTSSENRYKGNFTLVLVYEWWIKGKYSFGGSSSGYSAKVEDVEEKYIIKVPNINRSTSFTFNKTFIRDSFSLGAKPFEKVEVKVIISIYPQNLNSSNTEIKSEQALATFKKGLLLLDDFKIDYVKGKFEDFENEIELLNYLPKDETSLDEEHYLRFFQEMNESLYLGSYFNALEIYRSYERSKVNLLSELIYDLNYSIMEKNRVSDVENRVQRLEGDYRNLKKDYIELQEAYHLKNIQLEKQQQIVITALAGIWLSAFVFFLIGRSSNHLKLNLLKP
jgi:hypothetical protein